MAVIDIRTEFKPEADERVVSPTVFSHKVKRGKLKGSDKVWICKEISDPAAARLEALAQEFFRLIIPHQPETRLAINPVTGVYYILSEEVQGYKLLPKNQAHNFANGTFTGLGQALLVALFIEEDDLKNGNIGLNEKNQVIKIDGNLCFAQLLTFLAYKITPETIAALPYPKDITAYYWLDMIFQDVKQSKSSIVNPELAQSSQFRAEVNQAILKICLLTDEFIKSFVDAYIPAGGERFIALLKRRCELLRASALRNPSFVHYIGTQLAHTEVMSFLSDMKQFNAAGEKPIVVDTAHRKLEQDALRKMKELHFPTAESNHLIDSNVDLMVKIHEGRVGGVDSVIDSYLQNIVDKSKLIGHNIGELNALHVQLTNYLTNLSQSQLLMADILKLIPQIKNCQVDGYDQFLKDYISDVEEEISACGYNNKQLTDINRILREQLPSFQDATVIIEENQSLIAKLKEFQVGDYEPHLNRFLKKKEKEGISSNYAPEKLSMIKKELQEQISFVTDSLPIYNKLASCLQEINRCRIDGYDDVLFDYMESTENRMMENKNSPERLADMTVDLENQVELCKQSKPLIEENIQLLGQVPSYKINKEDKLVDDYVKATEVQIKKNANDPEKLLAINKNIKAVLESVQSPQIQDVLAVIRSLLASRSILFTTTKTSKAAQIERALCDTPLLKRGTVISQKGKANAVQNAIASHRVRGKTYKTRDEKIDLAKAPNAYKVLVAKYSGVVHVKAKAVRPVTTEQDSSTQAKP